MCSHVTPPTSTGTPASHPPSPNHVINPLVPLNPLTALAICILERSEIQLRNITCYILHTPSIDMYTKKTHTLTHKHKHIYTNMYSLTKHAPNDMHAGVLHKGSPII